MKELDRLREIVKSLRKPEHGRPRDREHTFESLRDHGMEGMYELVDAIGRNDMAALRNALGDLFFHILFYAELADEKKAFNLDDVLQGLMTRLERRHPSVFADSTLNTADQANQQKKKIKTEAGTETHSDGSDPGYFLGDISAHLPAMYRAIKLQKRAASIGFDWKHSVDIIAKIEEEALELRQAGEAGELDDVTEELGDLMFCCVNLARRYELDPELVLRAANEKFIQRFNYIEQGLKKAGQSLAEATLDEMDALWDASKKNIAP